MRARSRLEIENRLRQREYPGDVIGRVIAKLEELKYIDDEKFAREWMKGVMQTRPLGLRALRFKLRRKLIAEEIVEKLVAEAARDFPAEEAVKDIVARQQKRLAGLDPWKRKKRIYDYLRRRGFNADVIRAELKDGEESAKSDQEGI